MMTTTGRGKNTRALGRHVGGGNLNSQAGDLAATACWGHAGKGGVTMPGKGKNILRPYTSEERGAIEQGAETPRADT